jgi:ADP-dependent phosphofructokinase/glucokinase
MTPTERSRIYARLAIQIAYNTEIIGTTRDATEQIAKLFERFGEERFDDGRADGIRKIERPLLNCP